MYGQFAGYWRERKRLVMDRNAALPDRCVKCNEPADGFRKRVKVTYSPIGLTLLFGELALIFAKRATLEIGLCEQHRRGRSRAIGGVLFAIASFGASLYVAAQPSFNGLVFVAALFGSVGALIYAVIVARTVQAAKITDTHIWLKGCGAAFLDSLPIAPALADSGALPRVGAPFVAPQHPATVARAAYVTARNGALAFAAGCVITAGTYVTARGGRYEIVWGLVIVGAIALVRGLAAYRKVPAADRPSGSLVTIGAILLVALASGGYVIANEVQAYGDVALVASWNKALDAADAPHLQGARLFAEVMDRTGTWAAQDQADMTKIAGLYTQAAATLETATPPSSLVWYRAGIVKNYRDAADIANGFAKMTASSSQGTFDGLVERWGARVREFSSLQQRYATQVGGVAAATASPTPKPTSAQTAGARPSSATPRPSASSTATIGTSLAVAPQKPGSTSASITITNPQKPNTTLVCTIFINSVQYGAPSNVTLNAAGVSGCGIDSSKFPTEIQGKSVLFVVTQPDGIEVGRAQVFVPKP